MLANSFTVHWNDEKNKKEIEKYRNIELQDANTRTARTVHEGTMLTKKKKKKIIPKSCT